MFRLQKRLFGRTLLPSGGLIKINCNPSNECSKWWRKINLHAAYEWPSKKQSLLHLLLDLPFQEAVQMSEAWNTVTTVNRNYVITSTEGSIAPQKTTHTPGLLSLWGLSMDLMFLYCTNCKFSPFTLTLPITENFLLF